MTKNKNRIEDHLFCADCLIKGNRIVMKPLWKFEHVGKKVYLWFICPNKREGEKGCGHKSVREVSVFMSMPREEREKSDVEHKHITVSDQLKNGK